jgi:hypothetical protein
MKDPVSQEIIEKKIFIIRGHKVMLDIDLAELYDVPTKALNQAVRRNIKRFPSDFMFKLSKSEFKNLRSQFVTAKYSKRRFYPYVFTEQGVAMLSSVINSERAIQVNIAIIRVFVRIRQILSTHRKLAQKLAQLEQKTEKHDTEITAIFDAIRQLMAIGDGKIKRIGFKTD